MLVYAHTRMPKKATDCTEFTSGSRSSTLLYVRDACLEDSRVLATLSSRRELWRVSPA